MTDSFRRLSKSVVRISLHKSKDFDAFDSFMQYCTIDNAVVLMPAQALSRPSSSSIVAPECASTLVLSSIVSLAARARFVFWAYSIHERRHVAPLSIILSFDRISSYVSIEPSAD